MVTGILGFSIPAQSLLNEKFHKIHPALQAMIDDLSICFEMILELNALHCLSVFIYHVNGFFPRLYDTVHQISQSLSFYMTMFSLVQAYNARHGLQWHQHLYGKRYKHQCGSPRTVGQWTLHGSNLLLCVEHCWG